jgi:hydroxypyruvate isomerase
MSDSAKIAANISMLFREVATLDRFQAARAAGFDGVEMQFPYAESPNELARAAQGAGMPIVLINAPASREYPFGLAGRPEMRDSFRSQLTQISEYAEALDVRFVHVLAGPVHSIDERESCCRTYTENLLLAADALAPRGVGVLVEALNAHDVPNYLVGTLADAESLLDRCRQRVALQFDLYHVARMGLDPVVELKRCMPFVRHVQFADAPGRHEPGTGSVKFDSALEVLNAGGYAGWLSAEYIPLAATSAGMAWLGSWRRGMCGLPPPRN